MLQWVVVFNEEILMFHEYFEYDETSRSCLRWKVTLYSDGDKGVLLCSIGDEAGSLEPNGYWRTSLKRQRYGVHRIVWEIHNGKIPDGLFVDHIDGNRSNNKIANLRLATHHQNNTNSKLSKNNTTGVRGVKYREYKYSKAYICSWKDLNGVQRSKSFTIGKYSKEEAFRLACEYRKKIIDELNKAGLYYNE